MRLALGKDAGKHPSDGMGNINWPQKETLLAFIMCKTS